MRFSLTFVLLYETAIGSGSPRVEGRATFPQVRRGVIICEKMIPASLQLDHALLADICGRYGVSKLSLFGSMLHGSSDGQSDVDLLVEFPPLATPSLLELGALQQDLAHLMGREVDLKTPGFLSPQFRAQVLSEALTLYAA